MKQILTETDKTLLKEKIEQAEIQTKTQIVLAIVKKCDIYSEIPWKAFALGSSIAGFMVFLYDLLFGAWVTDSLILFAIAAIFMSGTSFMLLTLLLPGFARLFLSKSRRETEALQYAESLFLSHELFQTEYRRGILLFVSRFERQVVILPDTGIRTRLSVAVMKNIILKMTKYLKNNESRYAFETGLEELVKALTPPLKEKTDKDELSNEIIEEEGV